MRHIGVPQHSPAVVKYVSGLEHVWVLAVAVKIRVDIPASPTEQATVEVVQREMHVEQPAVMQNMESVTALEVRSTKQQVKSDERQCTSKAQPTMRPLDQQTNVQSLKNYQGQLGMGKAQTCHTCAQSRH